MASGALNAATGLHAVENVPGSEDVDVTDRISGHVSHQTLKLILPILNPLGIPVSADFFDEPVVCCKVALFSHH